MGYVAPQDGDADTPLGHLSHLVKHPPARRAAAGAVAERALTGLTLPPYESDSSSKNKLGRGWINARVPFA
jgi:hypothetical protein